MQSLWPQWILVSLMAMRDEPTSYWLAGWQISRRWIKFAVRPVKYASHMSQEQAVLVDIVTSRALSFKCLTSTKYKSSSDLAYSCPSERLFSFPSWLRLRPDLPIFCAEFWASFLIQLTASQTHQILLPYWIQMFIIFPNSHSENVFKFPLYL